MGMDLTNGVHEFRWSCTAWRKLLFLAFEHGWQPGGAISQRGDGSAEADDDEAWIRSYMRNDGAVVSATDAAALASALEAALPLVPKIPVLGKNLGWLGVDFCLAYLGSGLVAASTPDRSLEPLAYFSGEASIIRDFIAFSREGPFHIF